MKLSSHDLAVLAVMFRTNSPNLWHVDTLEAMMEAGLAYSYGLLRGTPQRHKRKARAMREAIAGKLERMAKSEGCNQDPRYFSRAMHSQIHH